MLNNSLSLSKNDLADVLDFITACTYQKPFAEVASLFKRLNSIVPADGIATVIGHTNGKGQIKESHIVNISYPKRWIDIYEKRNYAAIDPIVQHHFANFMTQKWSDTFSMEQSALVHGFWEEARSFGLAAGLTMGIHDKENMRASLFSFSGKKLEQEPRHMMIMNYILPHLHKAFFKSNFGKINTFSELTEREKEVLMWVKSGKTNWEISCILTISERTVKFHLKNVSDKLGARGRTYIVAVALSRGIIDF